jgi:zinc-finger binding domain of transposase IS66/Transposase C of IS166 homeodomain
MVDDKKNKKPPKIDLSKPDSLVNLDQAALIGLVNSLYDQNRQLSELLQQFLREKYGRKTERFVDSGQLTLFDTDQKPADSEAADPPEKKQKNRSKRGDRNPRPSLVTRIRTKVKELASEDLICKCCGQHLVKVNEIVVHSRYDYIPASTRIEELIEDVFACPACSPAVVSAANLAEPKAQTEEHCTNQAERTALAGELTHWLSAATMTEDTPSQIMDDAVAIGRARMLRTVAQIAQVSSQSQHA